MESQTRRITLRLTVERPSAACSIEQRALTSTFPIRWKGYHIHVSPPESRGGNEVHVRFVKYRPHTWHSLPFIQQWVQYAALSQSGHKNTLLHFRQKDRRHDSQCQVGRKKGWSTSWDALGGNP